MNTINKLKTCLSLGVLALSLSACAAPPALQLLSLAIDGISYLATDKTIADHGLSALSQKDCKMLRTFKGDDICVEEDPTIKPAALPLPLEEPAQEDTILLFEKPNVPAE